MSAFDILVLTFVLLAVVLIMAGDPAETKM